MEDKEHYFQSIARHFIQLRGTPFFLSSKELGMIDSWETQGIPLHVVLEGIKAAYENFRKQSRVKARKLSLIFCQREVSRAFEQYRNRKVGQKGRIVPRMEKRNKIRAEVKRFLAEIPEEVLFLQEVFTQLHDSLSQIGTREEKLEEIEEYIERLLWEQVSHREIEQAKKDIQDEFQVREPSELARLAKVKLIKRMRDMFKIPYISPFYY